MNIRVVLLEPEIPQNTGNIARTCAAVDAELILVEPLGYSLDDRYLKRAGLDYWSLVRIKILPSIAEFLNDFAGEPCFFTTAGAEKRYDKVEYPENSVLVFGKESTGIPSSILDDNAEQCIRIPMRPGLRSLNLSNSAALVVYEVMRKHDFPLNKP